MLWLFRSSIISALIASLMGVPAMAVEKPIGMVTATQSAYVSRTQAATGVDVYSGDVLGTDPGGTLRLKVKATQLYLLSASAATLSKTDAALDARLNSGTIGFSTIPDDRLQIETPVATVRAVIGQRAFGQVTITAPDTILVSAYHGSLVVNGHGEERTIKEGEAYNVKFVPDPAPAAVPTADPAGAPPPRAYNSGTGHLIFALVIVGIAAVVGAIIYHKEAESDSVPQ
jgi:hypothetical protein